MNLDKRLEAVAKFVPKDARLGDIGTDHAYLPAILLKENKIKFAIATDVAEKPCLAAKKTLIMYGVKKNAEIRLGDGLQVLQKGECDCLVFAGMGGTTIMEILQKGNDVARSASRLIFQPMQAAYRLREYLCQNNFSIIFEDLVEDGKYLYEIIVATPQKCKVYNKSEYIIGPLLLQEKHSLLLKQFAKQKNIYQRMIDGMEKSLEMKNSEKYKNCKKILKNLEELENDYCK